MGFKQNVFRNTTRAFLAAAALFAALPMAHAADLVPQTKFRVKIIQWMPVKSAYEQWDALGGEFIVSTNGDVTLPVVGQLKAASIDTETLANEIAERLQKKTGLVTKPDVSVEIVEYPPVYVVGDVTTPGQYTYREGMTVMQAVALGGGTRRSDGASVLQLLSDMRAQNDEVLLNTARIARLEAELNGADKVTFPDVSQIDPMGMMQGVFQREQILFDARAEELARQSKSLEELRDLFNAEIEVLNQKRESSDQAVKNAEKELAGVSSLVDKGFAVASRKSEMERVVSSFKSDSLDQSTAIMRARQGVAEATRNLDALRDRRRSDAAADLQTSKAQLEQAKVRRDLTQRLLFEAMGTTNFDPASRDNLLAYTIVRNVKGKPESFEATEITQLQPGDVINAKFKREPGPADEASLTTGKAARKQVSQ